MKLTLKKTDFTKEGWSNFLKDMSDQQKANNEAPSEDWSNVDFVDMVEVDTDKPNEICYTFSPYYTAYLNRVSYGIGRIF